MTKLEALFRTDRPEILHDIAANDRAWVSEWLLRITKAVPKSEPWLWVIENAAIKTPVFSGRFNPTGREYMRQMVNDINDDGVAEQTVCAGTGSGKTMKNLAQALWAFENYPFSGLYVMPTKEGEGGARQFNNGSVISSIENTECLKAKLPVGAQRHKVSGLHVEFGGNNLGFVGANSPTQLGAKRCRIVWLDEQDKYKEQLGREAGADYLAGERTKQVLDKKIVRSSTPTKELTGIWPHLMSSDLCRRFLPCPHCNSAAYGNPIANKGWFVLIKDRMFSVLPDKLADGTAIPLAPLVWDKESKRKDKSWDIDRVVASARFECPHCGGHVRDHHRLWLDKNGVWLATRRALLHAGYHLSSYNAPHVDFDSSWGGMAKKFIDNFEAGTISGYINSDLAEVNVSQEKGRIEIASDRTFAQNDWIPLMSADFQKLWPFIWFIVQKFSVFKLQPPAEFKGEKPEFAAHLDKSPRLKSQCESIVNGTSEAWLPLSEILRFDPCSGEFPPLEWMIAQNLTGSKLVNLYRTTCGSKTLDFGRYIYREMGVHLPKGGDSEIISAGYCELSGDDAWEELRDIQQQYHIGEQFVKSNVSPNRAVMIDSGYAEEHNPEVLRKCFESGFQGRWQWYDPLNKTMSPFKMHAGCLPIPSDCWVPFKGYPIAKRWRQHGSESSTHWNTDDPFKGLAEADKYRLEVLEAASEWYFHKWMDNRERQKDVLQAIKEHRSYRGNLWNVSNELELYPAHRFKMEDFERQMNAKGRDSDGEIWERGSGGGGKRRHPDHLNDCARNIYALAEVHGVFSYEPKTK